MSELPVAEIARSIAAAPGAARDAERALCQRYARRVRLFGLRHLKDEQLAADLVQQVLLLLIEALRAGRVEDPERLDSFVLSTARHLSWDLRRGERRREQLAERASAGLPEGYEPVWRTYDLRRIEHCAQELDMRERTVVILTFQEDQTAEEIGKQLGVSAGNVRVIRHRALDQLSRCVDPEGKGAAS